MNGVEPPPNLPPSAPSPDPGATISGDPAPPAIECSLCGNAVVLATSRCSECGLYQQLGPQHPNPFVERALATVILTAGAVYLVVLAIVAALPRSK